MEKDQDSNAVVACDSVQITLKTTALKTTQFQKKFTFCHF